MRKTKGAGEPDADELTTAHQHFADACGHDPKTGHGMKPTFNPPAKWIGTLHKGGLHESLGIPQGQKIPPGRIAAAASKGGKLGKQARAAQTLSKLRP